MKRRPWWHLRPDDDDEPDEGQSGDSKVRVPTHLDPLTGEPDGWVWAEADAADGWDTRKWRLRP